MRAEARPFRALVAPVRGRLAVAAALAGAAAALELGPYVGVYLLVREVLGDGAADPARVWSAVALVAAAAVAAFGLRMAAATVCHHADVAVQRGVRRRIAAHLTALPLGWFVAHGGGATVDRLRSDVDDLHDGVAHGRSELITAVVTPLLAVAWLASVDVVLTVVVLAPSVLVALYQRRVLARSAERIRGVGESVVALRDAAVELVRDLPTVRVVARGRAAQDRMTGAAHRFRVALEDAYEQDTMRIARSGSLVDAAATLLLVGVGGALAVGSAWLAPLEVLPFVLMAVAVARPLQDVALARGRMRTAHLAAGRITALLDEPALAVPASPRRIDADAPDVVFDAVSFAYLPDAPTLVDVDLTLPTGSVTALVGPSGAGKSTLASLVARFHDVGAGAVRVGGVDVRETAPDDLYRTVGFVLQDAGLLRLSLRDTLRLGRPDATDAEIGDAARAASIHDRIAATPGGYDAVVGEDVELSGGERQRVAIARTLLADPPVLVLDESTAHLDAETEGAVTRALLAPRADGSRRTVLVVAHRLATVRHADRIVVLDGGHVAAQGTHDDLLAGDDLYARLWGVDGDRLEVAP